MKVVKENLVRGNTSLIIITGVSSELEIIQEDLLLEVVKLGEGKRFPYSLMMPMGPDFVP